ncbi:class I SAM-dependent methyltransferase [Zoogloea sp.]|uniref:class I SAM-dependent methyltransferase n=1 Tax=Zoogloea sp. TaxID=49181 RepID=UPI0031FC29B8
MTPNFPEFVNAYPEQGIHTIKLKDLLNLRAPQDLCRDISTAFPSVTIGSITLVDQIVLLCLDELLRPEGILEIGTFQGFTTRLLAKNSAARTIYSVDLPPTTQTLIDTPEAGKVLSDGDYNDDYLRDLQNRSGEIYLNNLPPAERSRISLIKADSTQLDFAATFGPIEFAFIDGGHHYDIVRSDTEKVASIMKRGVIVWHDFSSGIHSDVTRYLADRASTNRIFHVHGSLCAFQLVSQ